MNRAREAESGTAVDSLVAEVRELAEPLTAEHGVDLLDVEVKGQRGSRVVRVVVDSETGVGVDTCAEVSRDLERRLDEADPVAGRYTLEVTSPGATRPLTTPRDLRRNVGRSVRVVRTGDAVAAGAAGEVTGELIAVDEHGITLDVDGEAISLPLSDVEHARVVLPW